MLVVHTSSPPPTPPFLLPLPIPSTHGPFPPLPYPVPSSTPTPPPPLPLHIYRMALALSTHCAAGPLCAHLNCTQVQRMRTGPGLWIVELQLSDDRQSDSKSMAAVAAPCCCVLLTYDWIPFVVCLLHGRPVCVVSLLCIIPPRNTWSQD